VWERGARGATLRQSCCGDHFSQLTAAGAESVCMAVRAAFGGFGLVLLAGIYGGCFDASAGHRSSVSGADGFRVGDVRYTESCVYSASDACSETCSDCWDRCHDAALETGGSCAATCDGICECPSGDADICYEDAYVFEAGSVDEDVASACEAWIATSQRVCGADLASLHDWCRERARVVRHDTAQFFRCSSELVSEAACLASCDTASTPLTSQLCTEFETSCGSCPLVEAAAIDRWATLLRPEVTDAASACLELANCSSVSECLVAWETLVVGAP
jgi:hypothetical protein